MIAVIGASGFLGRHLIKRLQADNKPFKAVVRPGQSNGQSDLPEWDIESFACDVRQADKLNQILQGTDTVINLVGARRPRGQTFYEVNDQGTRNVVAAAELAGVKRLIHIGIAKAAEDAPSLYLRTKFWGEEHVKNSKLKWTILKPTAMYGPDDASFTKIARMLKQAPAFPVFGDGKYKMQPVYVEDVVEIIIRCLSGKKTEGKILDVAGPRAYTYMEVLVAMAGVIGKKKLRTVSVPLFMARTGISVAQFLPFAPITRDELELLLVDAVADDLEATEKMLNISFLSMEEGFELCFGQQA